MNLRNLFFQHIGQTSFSPLSIQINRAKGVFLFDENNKPYLDAISGINVSYLGHCNPFINKAIKKQLDCYSHIMVYGEMIQAPQVLYAQALINTLPDTLNSIYFTNSGSEAVEAAMKLAKRTTQRSKMIAFKNSYHGSTQGALSILGDEYWRNAYRPLLPDVYHLNFNDWESINQIDVQTACVILEPIQAEIGILPADKEWLKALALKCKETKTLLIFDEIQSGFARCGSLWAFEQYDLVPDILLLGKALGGGLPLGALVTHKNILDNFAHQPILGHITTFGGNAISCTAGLAGFEYLLKKVSKNLPQKESFFKQQVLSLQSPQITSKSTQGLWASLTLSTNEECLQIVQKALQKGLLIDWFLFSQNSIRLAPPLTISIKEIRLLFSLLQECL